MSDKEYIDYLFDKIDTLEAELQNEHECRMDEKKYIKRLEKKVESLEKLNSVLNKEIVNFWILLDEARKR